MASRVALRLRIRRGRQIMYDGQRKIVQISQTELVKGPCSQQELDAMQYAALNTSVNVPRIHRVHRLREGLFITMEFIDGIRLDELWTQIDDAEKRDIVLQIHNQVKQLHACCPPASLSIVGPASISGGPVFDGALGRQTVGPSISLEEFKELVTSKRISPRFDAQSSQISFVHADLAPRNIIRATSGQLFIIDWEFAGWWPIYWERVKWHFANFPPLPGWVELMDEIYDNPERG